MKSNFILNLILLTFLFFTIKCLKINTLTDEEKDSKENIINLRITKDLNQEDKYVEKDDVIISFKTDYKDDKNIFVTSELEEKSVFETKIKDNLNNKYNTTCKLWKPLDDNIRVICNFTGSINKDASHINLNNITFQYDNKYNITIIQTTEEIRVIPSDAPIPFIYSNSQTINIEEDKSTSIYELKFNVSKYNKEFIVIQNGDSEQGQLIIDNCEKNENNEKELICKLKKEDILEILWNNKNTFSVAFLSYDFGYYHLSDAGNITINYNGKNKEDIYINITEVKDKEIFNNRYVTFDTNVSSIDNLVSKKFNLTLKGMEGSLCFFKKSKTKKLLLLCSVKNLDNFTLEPNNEQIELSDIHYKYNFKILPLAIKISFTIDKSQINVYNFYNNYPKVLDFTKANSTDIILTGKFEPNNESIKNYALNSAEGNLQCQKLINSIKCKVQNENVIRSGFYDLLYYNEKKNSFAFYEISPFEVIFSGNNLNEIEIKIVDNNDIIKIGKKRFIYLDTDYNDTNNVTNKTEFENYNFTVNFLDSNNKEIESTCRIWKPKNEKLKLICQLNNDIDLGEHNITLNGIQLNFQEENITIKINQSNKIRIMKLDDNINFIYADKQEITLKDRESYNLTFKQLSYVEDTLYLYKNEMRYIKLNVCDIINDELICTVNKTNLVEILASNGENYYIREKSDINLHLFKSVLDITFKYETAKNETKVKIGNLLTKNVSRNEFVVYETNVTANNISTLITSDYFNINVNTNENIICILKKNNFYEKLLFLCNVTWEDGNKSLGIIHEQKFNDIHILHNFIIVNSENNEIFNVNGDGTKITYVYPSTLIFNEEKRVNESVIFETEHPDRLEIIKVDDNIHSSLNIESRGLHCENFNWYKKCIINITLFNEAGPHYISHLNKDRNGYIINYEVSGIDIQFTNDYNGIIVGISIIAGMIVIIAIAYGVWYYLKKKDEKDMNLDVEKEDIEVKKPINSEEKE